MKHLFILALAIGLLAACSGNQPAKNDPPAKITGVDSADRRLQELEQQISQFPKNPDNYFERAGIFYEYKIMDKALADINRAIGVDSMRADFYMLAADILYAVNKIDEANTSIEKALRINPKDIKANTKMGELQYYLGNSKKAFQYLDSALMIDPYQAKPYWIKGMLFKENGDTNLALSSFRTAVEQDPDYFHAYMQLAAIHAARHDKLAIDYYNNAIRINPSMVEAHYGLAYFLQEHGEIDGAIKVYNDLLSVDPNNSPALHNIGYIHLFRKEDPEAAIPWFTKAINADPLTVNAVYHRGLAYEQTGDFESARKDYARAIELDKEFDLPAKRLQGIKNK